MKLTATLAITVALVQSINIRGPKDEFAARREELQRDHVEKLTDMWSARVDNYDPDLDQEMATEIMNSKKREAQINKLEGELKHLSAWDPEIDDKKLLLRTLKQEQADYNLKVTAGAPL